MLINTIKILLIFLGIGFPLLQVTAENIIISGVEDKLLKNIRSFLAGIEVDCQALEEDIPLIIQQIESKSKIALQALGYYEPEITIQYQKEACWIIKVDIIPHQPVLIQNVDIQIIGQAAQDQDFIALKAESPLTVNTPLHHGVYENYKKQFQNLAQEKGYFNADWQVKDVLVSIKKHTADVRLHFASGERFYYGEISFQQKGFKEDFLRRFIQLKPEMPYLSKDIQTLQQDLIDSNYFNEIFIKQAPSENQVDLTIELIPRKRRLYEVGIGFATDVGLRGHLAFENRRVNKWGDRFNAQLRLSAIKQELQLNYEQPLEHPLTQKRRWQFSYLQEEKADIYTQATSFGVQSTQQIKHWLLTRYVNAQYERFSINNDTNTSFLLRPGFNALYLKVDNPLYPHFANRFEADISVASPVAFSDIQLLRVLLKAQVIRSYQDKHRFILKSALGSNQVDDFDRLPATLRFFAGGDNSIRGYAFNSIAPDQAGGRHLFTITTEYEYNFYKRWGGAIFYDAGSAFNDFDGFFQSAGLGLRWRSPIGPIRLDLAFPFDEKDHSPRLHFSLGSDL